MVGVQAHVKSVAVTTLGCKINRFESELILQRLGELNYKQVEPKQAADIYIINSCTVTAQADRQSRQQARKFKRLNPDALVIMTGCFAQNNAEEASKSPAVDWVVGNAAKLDLPQLIVEHAHQTKNKNKPQTAIFMPAFDEKSNIPKDVLSKFSSQSRAFIQIQQGCDQGCTFCIIHVARGPSCSFPVSVITKQYKTLVTQGAKEVVLCGVDLGAYGDDLLQNSSDNSNLAGLLSTLLALGLDCRIRLSSIDPYHLSDRLMAIISSHPMVCSQLHLSLQSANDLILKRMKRRANRAMIYDRIALLRQSLPNLVLSADILVGFPTEDEHHFAQTASAIDDLKIAYPHVFPYSKRPDTPAARIPKQVDGVEIKRRARLLREIGHTIWQQQAQSRIGSTQRTIIETRKGSTTLARCDDYFPVELKNNHKIPAKGQWCQVKITGVTEQSLLGVVSGYA